MPTHIDWFVNDRGNTAVSYEEDDGTCLVVEQGGNKWDADSFEDVMVAMMNRDYHLM